MANPLGAISSFAMCLRHTLGRPDDALLLDDAVQTALERGARTRDLSSDPSAWLSTSEMADAVIIELERGAR